MTSHDIRAGARLVACGGSGRPVRSIVPPMRTEGSTEPEVGTVPVRPPRRLPTSGG